MGSMRTPLTVATYPLPNGGSFVVGPGNTPLVIAGGGGGGFLILPTGVRVPRPGGGGLTGPNGGGAVRQNRPRTHLRMAWTVMAVLPASMSAGLLRVAAVAGFSPPAVALTAVTRS